MPMIFCLVDTYKIKKKNWWPNAHPPPDPQLVMFGCHAHIEVAFQTAMPACQSCVKKMEKIKKFLLSSPKQTTQC